MGKEDVNDMVALVLSNTFDLVYVMKFRTSTLLLSLNFSPDVGGRGGKEEPASHLPLYCTRWAKFGCQSAALTQLKHSYFGHVALKSRCQQSSQMSPIN